MEIRRILFREIGFGDINFVLIGDLIGKGLSFIVSLLIMKYATPYEFGLFSFFISVLSLGVPLSDLGLNNTMVKYVSSQLSREKEIALGYLKAALEIKSIIVFSLMILIMLFADVIATSVLSKPEMTPVLRLASVAIVGGTYREFYASALQAYQYYKRLTLYRVTENLLKLGLVYTLLKVFGFDLEYLFLIFLALPFLLLVQGILLFPPTFHAYQVDRGEVYRRLFHFGKWVAISTISAVIMLQLDVFMLTSMREMGEVGKYAAAYRLCLPFFVLVNSITVVLYPRAMGLSTQNEYMEFIKKVLLITFPISALMVPVVLFGSDLIFSYFPQYTGSDVILQVLIVGFAVILVANPISLILYATDMPKLVAVINLMQLVANVVGNWILITLYGPLGAAMSTVGVWVLGSIIFTVFSIGTAKGWVIKWGKIE